MYDRIDLSSAKAVARNFSMEFPTIKEMRFRLMQKVSNVLQKEQGFFFFDQIYDIFEIVYCNLPKNIVSELEEWVEKDENIKFIEKQDGFYKYAVIPTI
jgi:hypothetical protein